MSGTSQKKKRPTPARINPPWGQRNMRNSGGLPTPGKTQTRPVFVTPGLPHTTYRRGVQTEGKSLPPTERRSTQHANEGDFISCRSSEKQQEAITTVEHRDMKMLKGAMKVSRPSESQLPHIAFNQQHLLGDRAGKKELPAPTCATAKCPPCSPTSENQDVTLKVQLSEDCTGHLENPIITPELYTHLCKLIDASFKRYEASFQSLGGGGDECVQTNHSVSSHSSIESLNSIRSEDFFKITDTSDYIKTDLSDNTSSTHSSMSDVSYEYHSQVENSDIGRSSPGLLLIEDIPASDNQPTEGFMIDMLKTFLISINLLKNKAIRDRDLLQDHIKQSNSMASEAFIKRLFKDTLLSVTNNTDLTDSESPVGPCYASESKNPSRKNEQKISQSYSLPPESLDRIQKDISTLKTNLANYENYKRQNNVKIRGIPESIQTFQLKNYITSMVSHLFPNTSEKFLINRLFRIRRPSSLPQDVARDVIVTFYPNWIRNALLNISKEPEFLSSPYSHLVFFKDLSKETIQKRKAFSLITCKLRRAGIPYVWTQESTLKLNYASSFVSITSPNEGNAFLQSAGIQHPMASSGSSSTPTSDLNSERGI